MEGRKLGQLPGGIHCGGAQGWGEFPDGDLNRNADVTPLKKGRGHPTADIHSIDDLPVLARIHYLAPLPPQREAAARRAMSWRFSGARLFDRAWPPRCRPFDQ
jgi:hypothetical protein